MKAAPCDRAGWQQHYAKVYNKTKRPEAAQLATWLLILITAFGE